MLLGMCPDPANLQAADVDVLDTPEDNGETCCLKAILKLLP